MITRLAPTPSGFLHSGNAVNFLLVAWLSAAHGGRLALRIDDADAARYRREYAEDVFRVLDWLGIEWQSGPSDVDDFERSHSQRNRTAHYRERLQVLQESHLPVYVCECSRRDLAQAQSPGCVRDCASRGLDLVDGRTALRARVSTGASTPSDVIVWRRDGLPSYHLASIVDDHDLGTTHVVRGMDLLESSGVQCSLAPALGCPSVASASYLHHPLVVDGHGSKLAKSRLTTGPMACTDAALDAVRSVARAFASDLGIPEPD